MKPENLAAITNELDGEDYDLNAVVDYFIDRRADGQQSERIYTKRLRRQRDVAVSFLLDQSSSTARTIGRHPLQPYTHPGRRIIEIEKEGLVLMSEALEAVGDVYSINGFTSEGRRNVKFYVLKDFSEQYSDEVMRRIGGITYQNNTRLGAAIRHASGETGKAGSAHASADRSVRRPALRSRLWRCALRARGHARSFATGKDRTASRLSASPSIANRKPSCAISTATLATRSSTTCLHCRSGCRGFIDG